MVSGVSGLETVVMKKHLLAALLLLAHGLLMVDAARRLSPAWDEILIPSLASRLWKTRSLAVVSGQPFLLNSLCSAALTCSLPCLLSRKPLAKIRFASATTSPSTIESIRENFYCDEPLVIHFILVAHGIIAVYVGEFGNPGRSGQPSVLRGYSAHSFPRESCAVGNACLFRALGSCLHERWAQKTRPAYLYGCGIATGLALLCKLICLPLLLVFSVLQMTGYPPSFSISQRLANVSKLAGAALCTAGLLFLPWHHSFQAIKEVISLGLTYQKTMPAYFWHGQNLAEPPSLLSRGGDAVESPSLCLILGLCGLYAWRRSKRHLGLGPCTCIFRHIYILAAFLSARCQHGSMWNHISRSGGARGRFGFRADGSAVGSEVDLSSGGNHGFSRRVACASELPRLFQYHGGVPMPDIGGWPIRIRTGDTAGLADYLHAHGEPNVLLAYSGAADPRAYGIHFQDLLSPALFIRETRGEAIGSDAAARVDCLGDQGPPKRTSLYELAGAKR